MISLSFPQRKLHHSEKIAEQKVTTLREEPASAKSESVNPIGQKHGKAKFQREQIPQARKSDQPSCYRCGNTDHFGIDLNCPARGQKCHKCNGKDHFSKVSKTTRKPTKSEQTKHLW